MKPPQLKYKEVEAEMRQLAKTLPGGAKLPPERHLAITYNCNFLTVRKALKSLVEDGTIVRRIGSGTFVVDQTPGARPQIVTHAVESRIGLLVYHQGNAYAHRLLQSIAHSAMHDGVTLRSCWIQNFEDDAMKQAHALAKDGCSAIVLPWFPLDMSEEAGAFVKNSPLPVSLPMVIPGLEANYFGTPAEFASNLLGLVGDLCQYFFLLGRRRIAFLGPANAEDPILQKMLTSYTSFMSRNHLPNLAVLTQRSHKSMEAVAADWKQYRHDLGIVCYDDEHALRLMTAMHKTGFNAPDDFTIIGHNDTEASSFSDPPLTTISQEFSVISNCLLQKAKALARGEEFHSYHHTRSRLLIRNSCGGREKISAAMQKDLPGLSLVIEE